MAPTDAQIRFEATLDDNVSARASQLEHKLKRMGASPAEIKVILRAVDEATPKIKEAQRQMDELPRQQVINIQANTEQVHQKLNALEEDVRRRPFHLQFVDNISDTLDRLSSLRTKIPLPIAGAIPGASMLYAGGGLGAGLGAVAGIGNLVEQGVQVNSKMEQSMVQLQQTMKDNSKATNEMGKIVQMAQKTPFSYEDVLAADVRLRSYQIPAMQGEGGPQNKGWLDAAGNMAAAMNTPITQAVEAIADARQGYFVRMMSYGIRMMREDFQAGGKYAGMTYEQGLQQALKRFGGSMEMQSKTFQGVMSNLKDIAQQQIIRPIGLPAFSVLRDQANNLQNRLQTPDFQRRIGGDVQQAQRAMVEMYDTAKNARSTFMTSFIEPIRQISTEMIKLGKVFGQGFGFGAKQTIQTYAEAFYQVLTPILRIVNSMPAAVVQLTAMAKVMSMLGLGKIADPFLNLAKSINPLTFSITGLVKSLFQLPGALARLSVALYVKRFLDARQATKEFNSEVDKLGVYDKQRLNELNAQIDRMANGLGKSSTEMKRLSTQAISGIPVIGTGNRAQLGIGMARQAALYERGNWGVSAPDMIRAVQQEMGRTHAWTDAKDDAKQIKQFSRDVAEAASVAKDLGFQFKDLQTTMQMFGREANALNIRGYRGAPALLGLMPGRQNEAMTPLTTPQLNSGIYNYDELRRRMMQNYAQPSIDTIRAIGVGNMGRYWDFKNAPITSGIRDSFTSRQRQYEMNDIGTQRTADIVHRIAPDAVLPRTANPWIQRGVGTDIGSIARIANPTARVDAIFGQMDKTQKYLDSVTPKVAELTNKMNQLNAITQQYSVATNSINLQMTEFQHTMVPLQRHVEDIQMAMSKYQLYAVRPLERDMNRLNNQMAISSHTMQNAQYDMSKYSEGLFTGEQAALNQLHALEQYNKQLQLLQLQYQQMGAELGTSVYREGYSSRVAPMAGLSMQMQMRRLQMKQQRDQLQYELTYGEQHYQLQQAQRTRFQRQEMSFGDRMQGVQQSVRTIDSATAAQQRMQQQQFDMSQTMFHFTEHLQDQQDAVGGLQIKLQQITQSPHMRHLQDEQYNLGIKTQQANIQLTKQQITIDRWQATVDDAKGQMKDLTDLLHTSLVFDPAHPMDTIRKMLDMYHHLPQALGGLNDDQYNLFMQSLNRSEEAVRRVRKRQQDESSSWWSQLWRGALGVFTGDTWRTLGDNLKVQLGKIVGPGVAGVISATLAAAGTAASIVVGQQLARIVARYGVLTALAPAAERLLPTRVGRFVAGRAAWGAGVAGRFAAGRGWEALFERMATFQERFIKAAETGKDGGALVRLVRDFNAGEGRRGWAAFGTEIKNAFRLVRQGRGMFGATVGAVVGGPFAPLTSWIGRMIAEGTTFRAMFSRVGGIFSGAVGHFRGASSVVKDAAKAMEGVPPELKTGAEKVGKEAVKIGEEAKKIRLRGLGRFGAAITIFAAAADGIKNFVEGAIKRLFPTPHVTTRETRVAGEVTTTARDVGRGAQRIGAARRAARRVAPAVQRVLPAARTIGRVARGAGRLAGRAVPFIGAGFVGADVARGDYAAAVNDTSYMVPGLGQVRVGVDVINALFPGGRRNVALTNAQQAGAMARAMGAAPHQTPEGRRDKDLSDQEKMDLEVNRRRQAALAQEITDRAKHGQRVADQWKQLYELQTQYDAKYEAYSKDSLNRVQQMREQFNMSIIQATDKLNRDRNTHENRGFSELDGLANQWYQKIHHHYRQFRHAMGLTTGGANAPSTPADSGNPTVGPQKQRPDISGPAFAHGTHDLANHLIKGKRDSKGYLIRVGEEDDEAIIPLAPHRRERAKSLISQVAGRIGMANGGMAIKELHPGIDMAYVAARNVMDKVSSYANGGILQGVHPAVIAMANKIMQQFPGMQITAGTNGQHARNSYHYRGMAIDIAAAMNPQGIALMNKAARWVQSSDLAKYLAEGIHNQGLSIHGGLPVDPSFWGSTTWAQHANHLHVAVDDSGGNIRIPKLAGSALLGMQIPPLHRAAFMRHGLVGKSMFQSLNRMRRGMMAAMLLGGGTQDLSGFQGGGDATANIALGKRMAAAMGWTGNQWDALRSLWIGESGWRTGVSNYQGSGAYGIPQALPGDKMASAGADWRTNAATQIKWGLGYIKDRYGSPGQAYSQWLARQPHWYAPGIDKVETDRLAVLHAGERVQNVAEAAASRYARGTGPAGPDKVVRDVLDGIHKEIKKVREAVEHANDRDDKPKSTVDLASMNRDLRSRWSAERGQPMFGGTSLAKRILNAGDVSGGEATQAGVMGEQRGYRADLKGQRSEDQGLLNEMKKLSGTARSLLDHAKNPHQRRLAHHAVTATHTAVHSAQRAVSFARSPHGRQATRDLARESTVMREARRGVNVGLIRDITGRGLSTRERQAYARVQAARRTPGQADDKTAAANLHKVLQKGLSDNAKHLQALRREAAADAKNARSAVSRAAHSIHEEQKKHTAVASKSDTKRDRTDNSSDKRDRDFQKKSLRFLEDIAKKDLVTNIHNEAHGATLSTHVAGGRQRAR